MDIKTKHSLGDKVYLIHDTHQEVFTKCDYCDGTGRLKIEGKNKSVGCTECYAHGGTTKWEPQAWRITEISYIGLVRAELRNGKSIKVEYMLDSTGVGSGSIWKEENLFKTEMEAQSMCDKRNADKLLEA